MRVDSAAVRQNSRESWHLELAVVDRHVSRHRMEGERSGLELLRMECDGRIAATDTLDADLSLWQQQWFGLGRPRGTGRGPRTEIRQAQVSRLQVNGHLRLAALEELADQRHSRVALPRGREQITQGERRIVPYDLTGKPVGPRVGQYHAHQEVEILEVRPTCRERPFEQTKIEWTREGSLPGELGAARVLFQREAVRLVSRDSGQRFAIDPQSDISTVEMALYRYPQSRQAHTGGIRR